MRLIAIKCGLALGLAFSSLVSRAEESSDAIAARQAMQETVKTLNARIEDLESSNHSLRTRVDDLRRELQQVREELRKQSDQSALHEQIQRIADSVKDVDSKRRADNEKVLSELAKLGKQIADSPIAPAPSARPQTPSATNPTASDTEPKRSKPTVPDKGPEKGIEYVIKSGDTLSGIVKACRDNNIRVTQKMVMDANPDVNWSKLRVSQKVFIPLPN